MPKKKVTLSIESKVYDNFQKYCEENAIMLSKKIEIVMKDLLKNKKSLSLFFMLFLSVFLMSGVSAAQIFTDGFESGGLSGWTLSNNGNLGVQNWTASQMNPYSGLWHALGNPRDATEPASTLERTISTSGYSNITLTYYRKITFNDNFDDYQALWYDGSVWTAIESLRNAKTVDANYVYKEFNLSSSAENNPNFKIKFECTGGHVDDYCRVDNVNIIGLVIDTTPPSFSNYVESPTNNSAYSRGSLTGLMSQ